MTLNQDKVPIDLEEALGLLSAAFTDEELEKIKKQKSVELHHTYGGVLRNEWSLWDTDSILVTWFRRTYKVDHADDISAIILECMINDLNDEPRNDKVLAKKFIEHWKKQK
jgi:hypothetical protein